MKKLILSMATQAALDSILAGTNTSISTIQPFSINLTNAEKEGGRFMSRGREGYVRLVSGIATQNPDGLSRTDHPEELRDLLNYYAGLQAIRQAQLSLLEKIEETQLGAAADIMVLTDRYVASLQIARKDDASLDNAMREIDEWNKRFGNRDLSWANDDDDEDDEEDDDTDNGVDNQPQP